MTDPRSRIPSIDTLLGSAPFAELVERYPRSRVVEAARSAVERTRREVGAGDDPGAGIEEPERYAALAGAWLEADERPSLRLVINATGVVLHTNLGRAPLAESAIEAMRGAATGYSNLEYDLAAGARGSRYSHCVELVRELTGAEGALVVNNAAAALVLALNTLAMDRGVVVSRGELVEIGGGFRIPEVLTRAGARLVEVGSTNRTRRDDYASAVGHGVGALLKVHRSNFSISGFTEEASLTDLVAIGREHDLPVVHDLGSGLVIDPERVGLPNEPRARDSIRAGVDVVVVSGDKLLGGPQAGIIAGRESVIERMRRNPLCRALRVDKVTLAGLEATLRLYRDPEQAVQRIPILHMLATPTEELRARAVALAERLSTLGVTCRAGEVSGTVGGGTVPGSELPSWAVVIDAGERTEPWTAALRAADPPVVARVLDDRVVLDVRTVLPDQEDALVVGVTDAAAAVRPG